MINGSFVANAYKQALLNAVVGHTFMMALYSSAATLDSTTVAYTVTGEISGTGYSAGGVALAGAAVSMDGSVAILTFTTPSWPGATFTVPARAALIYDATLANAAVAVLDFGLDVNVVGGRTFSVPLPAATALVGLVRIA